MHPLPVAFIVVALVIWGDYLLFGRGRERTRFNHVKTAREAAVYALVLGTALFLTYLLFVA